MRRWQDNDKTSRGTWRAVAGGAGVAAALAAVLVWVSGQWNEAPEAVVEVPAAGQAPAPSAGDSAAESPTPSAAPQTIERMKQALRRIKSASMPPSEAAIDGKRERLLVTRRPGMAEMHGGPFSLLAEMREVEINHLGALDITIVEVPVGWDLDRLRELIAEDPSVEAASRDNVVQAQGRVVPNDPDFGQQGNLDHGSGADVNAPEAWAYTTGSEEVVVAVIDSGIDYSHLDLLPNLWVNSSEIANNNIDDDGNGYVDDVHGINATLGTAATDRRRGDPWDDNGHGTWVSGVIGARGNNGALLTGVNWNVRLMSIKALGSNGRGFNSDIVEGINYIASMSKNRNINIKVVNGSYGSNLRRPRPCPINDAEYRAITRLGEEGILFVTSAGNSGKNLDTSDRPDSPACFDHDHLITVASLGLEGTSTHTRRLHSGSNFGAISVDLAAPGRSIPSAGLPGTNTALPQSRKSGIENIRSGVDNARVFYYHGAEPGTTASWNARATTWAPTTARKTSGLYSWTDSPGGSYMSNQALVLKSPLITFNNPIGNDFLFFSARINTNLEYSNTDKNCRFCDYLTLDICIRGERTCRTAEAWSGSTGGSWGLTSFAIPPRAYISSTFSTPSFGFDFVLHTDETNNGDGVYIDDIRITRHATGADTWGRPSGTSFAAPHVAGAAALLWAHRPGLSVREVRAALLDNVDHSSELAGRVASGGSLNIAEALFSVTTAGLRIHSSQTAVREGEDGYLEVSLTREPRGTPDSVVVRATTATAGRITRLSPDTLTFTQTNWHLPQRIDFGTLTGVFPAGPIETLQLSVDAAQSDPAYAAVSRSVAVQVDVERDIYIHDSQTTVMEGESGYISISLTRAPPDTGQGVLLQIAASDPGRVLVGRPRGVRFRSYDWHRPQTVGFTVFDDRIVQPTTAAEFLQISVDAAESDPAWAAVSRSVAVQFINDDLWSVSTTSLTVREGSSATVGLAFHPLPQDISMTITALYRLGARPDDHITPSEIHAAAGSTGTHFTIRITDDDETEMMEPIGLRIVPSNPDVLGTEQMFVDVTIPANDPIATLEVSPTLLAEGGSAVVTVRLNIPVSSAVVFNINADPENPARYSLPGNPLTIRRETTHNSVVLSAPDNGVQEEGQTVTLTYRQTAGSDIPVIRGNPSTARLRIVDDLLLMRLRVFLEGAVSTDGRSTAVPDPP